MARFRTIKPQFFSSEQVVECSPTARLLFVGMWCFCDDGGVHPASPARLKMEVFPADPFTTEQVTEWIAELHKAGLLVTYRVDSKDFWRVTGWHHQKIEKPTYSYPRSHQFGEESATTRRMVGESSTPERKGAEGSGAERNGEEWRGVENLLGGRKAIGSASVESGGSGSAPRDHSLRSGLPPKENSKNGKHGSGERPEPIPLDEVDWDQVRYLAETVHARIPVRTDQDRRAWLRFGVLVQTTFSEDWLLDSVDAVCRATETKRTKQAHLVAVLKSKAAEQGFDEATFAAMLRRIEIPTDVWKSGVLEVRR